MIHFTATRYDGQTSSRQAVELRLDETGQLHVSGEGIDARYHVRQLKSKPRIGSLPAQLIFPDGTVCELAEGPELQAILRLLRRHPVQDIIHKIENNLLAILASLGLAVLVLFGVVQYGIPYGAKLIAYRIPLEMENRMGQDALAVFDQTACAPSKLAEARQREVEGLFLKALAKMHTERIQLHLRHCAKLGANAFALPSGIIIFTDDMINLAKDDRELIAVLAHEVGHVKHRHIMRQALQNSVTGLLLVLLTGDIGSASSLAATLPTLLVQAKFSRDFEEESDAYAAQYLKAQDIAPAHLGHILQRLAGQHGGKESKLTGFLSSHPLTDERIRKLQD